jgi:hypothetical protein
MSLNEISQENTQLPPEGVINATFKSLSVNGVPISGGGGGDLQSAYDNGNGIIDTDPLTKPFTVQTSGVDALVVNNSNLTINKDVVVDGFSSQLGITRNTGFFTLSSSTDLTISAGTIQLDGTARIQSDAGFFNLKPSTNGTALQSLVSDGAGGVEFESVRTYGITWAGNAVTGSRWLIPKGNALTPSGTAGTFATTFYCPHNMTGSVLAATREVTGGSSTDVTFYNSTAPGTPIYTYTFTGGAEIVVPALSLVAGETYFCIGSDSVGNATIVIDLTFTID